jgi:4-amino-4-deoxy-L-arabinose transferase-like glycosyltransferase
MDHSRRLATGAIWLAMAALGIAVLFAVPQQVAEAMTHGPTPLTYVCALLGGVLLLATTYRYGATISRVFERASEQFERVSPLTWILLCAAIGTLLRVIWVRIYPAPLHSDGLHYYNLAVGLVEKHQYLSDRGEFAYWPPGYPFLLYVGLKLLGVHTWVVTTVNLVLFLISVPAAYLLGQFLAAGRVARLAALLLAVWPNYAASAGLGAKEMVLVPLLLLVFFLYFRARGASMGAQIWLATAAGAILGLASLAHPSFLLFPAVLLAYEWLAEGLPTGLLRLLLLLLGLGLAIAPWAIRNHARLGHWVLISDNGGDVFYRANNSRATGGYVPPSGEGLPRNEVVRNKLGFQLGMQWIASHPGGFLWLASRKLTFLLGDDGEGVYESMKRGLDIGGWTYGLFRAIADAYWLLVWILILATMRRERSRALAANPEVLALMLSVLYLVPIHSMFETSARHHVPIIGSLAVLAAFCAVRSGPPGSQRTLARREYVVAPPQKAG